MPIQKPTIKSLQHDIKILENSILILETTLANERRTNKLTERALEIKIANLSTEKASSEDLRQHIVDQREHYETLKDAIDIIGKLAIINLAQNDNELS